MLDAGSDRDVDGPSIGRATTQAVSLSLFRFDGLRARAFAISQMALARGPLARDPEIGFYKLFGTGTREGFHPAPNLGVWGVLATWPDHERARAGVAGRPVFQRYRDASAENWTVYLRATSSRGRWAGRAPFETTPRSADEAPPSASAPLAVLTRAQLKPRHILAFWRHTPAIGAAIREQTTLPFKIGMGEAPWRNQVTFSIWTDAGAMRRFAYGAGPHAEAVKAVRERDWFREELFARFRVLGAEGSWDGRDPLALN